jgi:hypothetical protein
MELVGIHLVVFNRFLGEKQRAALKRFMVKLGIKPTERHETGKSDKPKDPTKKF